MKNITILVGAGLMALMLATCGDSTDIPDEPTPTTPPPTTQPPTTQPVGEPSGIGIEEPGAYSGFLWADETGVYLVKVLAESYPPQTVGPLRLVTGLDLETVPGLSTAQGITWSDQPVELVGTIVDGTLVVDG